MPFNKHWSLQRIRFSKNARIPPTTNGGFANQEFAKGYPNSSSSLRGQIAVYLSLRAKFQTISSKKATCPRLTTPPRTAIIKPCPLVADEKPIQASKEKTVLAIQSALISTVLLIALSTNQVIFWAVAALIIALGVAALVLVFFFLSYGKLWFQALMSQADVSFRSLVGMGFRKVRPDVIVRVKIMARQAGLDVSRKTGITTELLEAHYLAGGDVMRVTNSIIAAQRANIDLDFDRAAAIDLAGRDVMDAVRTSVYPKVIECPDPERSGKNFLSAMSKDGVELKIRARVTVRTNLEQLIGGATEETIIARVGESIISSIGSSEKHQDVLENPDRISRAVLERGLDAHTAFEIVSIDIADIDVGENIGARLQADQAEADTRVAQAAAEKRRADAIAEEQEMKADVAKQRAQLVLAEAEVPQAMAEAFRKGHLRAK